MSVRVVRDVPCPSCKGRGEYYDKHGYEDCPRCHGTGTITEPVTCAGCRHFRRYSDPQQGPFGLCLHLHGEDVAASFACAAWEARDGGQ